MGGPGCGGGGKSTSHSTKSSMPKSWGGMKAPKSASSKVMPGQNNFGQPKVKMSFSGKSTRRGY